MGTRGFTTDGERSTAKEPGRADLIVRCTNKSSGFMPALRWPATQLTVQESYGA